MKGFPVSIELTRTLDRYEDKILIEEAEEYAELGDNVVIKVPMWGNGRGLRIAGKLLKIGIPVNMTCCISVNQAILACELGVEYVSFFFRRIMDYYSKQGSLMSLKDTRDVLTDAVNIITSQCYDTKIIAGSIREQRDVVECFRLGVDIVTITPEIMEKLPFHPKTEETIKEFDKCWQEFSKR